MDPEANGKPRLGAATRRLAEHALAICENRVELALVELQEERDRIISAFWLSLAVAVTGLLAGLAVSVAIAIACWPWSPLGAMLILAALYGGMALFFYGRLARLRQNWHVFPDTLEELRKDRECLTKHLS